MDREQEREMLVAHRRRLKEVGAYIQRYLDKAMLVERGQMRRGLPVDAVMLARMWFQKAQRSWWQIAGATQRYELADDDLRVEVVAGVKPRVALPVAELEDLWRQVDGCAEARALDAIHIA